MCSLIMDSGTDKTWSIQLCVLSEAGVPGRTNMANTEEEAESHVTTWRISGNMSPG